MSFLSIAFSFWCLPVRLVFSCNSFLVLTSPHSFCLFLLQLFRFDVSPFVLSFLATVFNFDESPFVLSFLAYAFFHFDVSLFVSFWCLSARFVLLLSFFSSFPVFTSCLFPLTVSHSWFLSYHILHFPLFVWLFPSFLLSLNSLLRRWTWTGDFKCREVKTGFYRNRSMQTGSSGTLIGWKSGQTTFVPLWGWMEGAWLRTPLSAHLFFSLHDLFAFFYPVFLLPHFISSPFSDFFSLVLLLKMFHICFLFEFGPSIV